VQSYSYQNRVVFLKITQYKRKAYYFLGEREEKEKLNDEGMKRTTTKFKQRKKKEKFIHSLKFFIKKQLMTGQI
jgi:hypothetical protein